MTKLRTPDTCPSGCTYETGGQARGPETIGDVLDRLDAADTDAIIARDDAPGLPRWRARAIDPDAEGVAPRWRIGKDLTGSAR